MDHTYGGRTKVTNLNTTKNTLFFGLTPSFLYQNWPFKVAVIKGKVKKGGVHLIQGKATHS